MPFELPWLAWHLHRTEITKRFLQATTVNFIGTRAQYMRARNLMVQQWIDKNRHLHRRMHRELGVGPTLLYMKPPSIPIPDCVPECLGWPGKCLGPGTTVCKHGW